MVTTLPLAMVAHGIPASTYGGSWPSTACSWGGCHPAHPTGPAPSSRTKPRPGCWGSLWVDISPCAAWHWCVAVTLHLVAVVDLDVRRAGDGRDVMYARRPPSLQRTCGVATTASSGSPPPSRLPSRRSPGPGCWSWATAGCGCDNSTVFLVAAMGQSSSSAPPCVAGPRRCRACSRWGRRLIKTLVLQHGRHHDPGGDAELGEHVGEVSLDGPDAEGELFWRCGGWSGPSLSSVATSSSRGEKLWGPPGAPFRASAAFAVPQPRACAVHEWPEPRVRGPRRTRGHEPLLAQALASPVRLARLPQRTARDQQKTECFVTAPAGEEQVRSPVRHDLPRQRDPAGAAHP